MSVLTITDNPTDGRERRSLCRFLGRRVAALEPGAVLAGVREAPRHEIAWSVRGGFRKPYGELVRLGQAPGAAERLAPMDVVVP